MNSITDIYDLTKLKCLIVEYIFIDGYNTTRSKTRIIQPTLKEREYSDDDHNNHNSLPIKLFIIENWNVDGSSTGQSETKKSDLILVPRSIFNDPFNTNNEHYKYILCMCEVFNIDGTPHITNKRDLLLKTLLTIGENKLKEYEPLFGIEQEYVILDKYGKYPYQWNADINNSSQGKYYCSVGSDRAFGRKIVMEHMKACLEAGISICGINSEVAPSQWEFQIGICAPFIMGDHLWMARYILSRIAELNEVCVSYAPKPYGIKWNGSGGHTNFSTSLMRSEGGIEHIYKAIDKLKEKHCEHMLVYGEGNAERLIGLQETSNINVFTYGDCDREASIRIPINVKQQGYGYLEDRRPAANLDPYIVCAKILETLCSE